MIGIILGAVIGALALAIAAAMAYRRLRQRRVARALRIDAGTGIAEGRFVAIGGVDQWIHIRGSDRTNPVLLMLSGSGLTLEPFSSMIQSWERHFTIAVWDRRDVGRTRGRNGRAGNETWTCDQLAADGIEVAEYLRERLHQDKLVLLGHSQGTIIGTAMARRRPELFHAYVGTGQVVDMARNEPATYQMAVQRARTTGNKRAARALRRLAPPYRDARTWIAKQRWSMATDPAWRPWQQTAARTVMFWPGYSLADVYRSAMGALFLPPRLFEETMACTPRRLGTTFDIPVFLLHGDADLYTLPALAEEYLASIDAPAKDLVLLPGGGHMTLLTEPDRFLAELLTRIRPLIST